VRRFTRQSDGGLCSFRSGWLVILGAVFQCAEITRTIRASARVRAIRPLADFEARIAFAVAVTGRKRLQASTTWPHAWSLRRRQLEETHVLAQVNSRPLFATNGRWGCPLMARSRIVLVKPTARSPVPLGGRNPREAK